MNPHRPTRFATCVVIVGIVSAAGCGKPPAKSDPKADPGKAPDARGAGTTGGPGPGAGGGAQAPAAAPAVLAAQGPIHQAAEQFLKDLSAAARGPGPFPADVLGRVSPAFLKVIGKPVLSPGEAATGYSPSAAEGWLRRAGGALGAFVTPTGYGSTAGAVFVGTANSGAGHFLLRLVPAGSGWQVAWFQIGTARANEPTKAASGDEPLEDFAAQAFLDAITATGAGSTADRVALLGALLTPRLRAALGADPFDQDKERGYGYSPAKLSPLADGLSDPNAAYGRAPTGPGQFKVELTRGGAKKAWSLKLVKGTEPTEWLVDEFSPL